MSKAASSPGWFAGWRAARRPAPSDPADLGTAFGLDMSYDQLANDPAAASAGRRKGWLRRLTQRRKPEA